jgi:exopolysaccharide biosynthesis protein
MSGSVNAVVASSGDFYAYRRYGAVVWNGKLHRAYNGQLDLCLVDDRGDLKILRAWEVPGEAELQRYIEENNVRLSLAFGPVIVEDGEQVYTGPYPVGENGDNFSRAAICQMEDLHYLLCAANMEYGYPMVPTLNEFAGFLTATGCRTAYTLDGGQTAAIAMQDTLVNQVSYGSQRRISDIVYFATALPDGG